MPADRYALVIASDQYKDSGLRRLTAPSHDAETLAATLSSPMVGDFKVDVLVNQPSQDVRRRIEAFFRERRRDDLLLLYFSGHGLKDETGRLFLAMTDTERQLLNATSVPATFVQDAIERTRSSRTVLLLDCCYGGAFAHGMRSKGDPSVHVNDMFGASGSVVLTASNETQYAFEDETLIGAATASVFTRILVEGLRSGEADLDSDGYVDVDELFDYVGERIVAERPEQRPSKWDLGVDGRIVLGRNPNWHLPQIILDEMADPAPLYRLRAVEDLVKLCRRGNDVVKVGVQDSLRKLVEDDSKQVSKAASTAMARLFAGDAKGPGVIGVDVPPATPTPATPTPTPATSALTPAPSAPPAAPPPTPAPSAPPAAPPPTPPAPSAPPATPTRRPRIMRRRTTAAVIGALGLLAIALATWTVIGIGARRATEANYLKLIGHLPITERATCAQLNDKRQGIVASARCHTGSYDLYESPASAQEAILAGATATTCNDAPSDLGRPYAHVWEEAGKSGWIRCVLSSLGDGKVLIKVSWTFSDLPIYGTFATIAPSDLRRRFTALGQLETTAAALRRQLT